MDITDTSDPNNVVEIKRNAKGRFEPGSNANPKGGNKTRFYRDPVGNRLDIQDLFLQNTGRVFFELLKVIVDKDTPSTARVSAIKEYFDRALGRPAQTIVNRRDGSEQDLLDLSTFAPELIDALAHAKALPKE